MGLTLLDNASLPLKFWGEAFTTTAYLINCLPTPNLQNSSPMEMLFNKTPDYQSLRTLGCVCYPYTRPYSRYKMQYRSEQCIFLGYIMKQKGYLCLSPTGKTYISRHVIFDEHQFPFQLNPNFMFVPVKSNPSVTHYLPSIPTLSYVSNIPCSNQFSNLEHVPESSSQSLSQEQEPTQDL